MGAHSFDDLRRHVGHQIVCVIYGKQGPAWVKGRGLPVNVAVECETCNEVLLDFDREDSETTKDALAGPMREVFEHGFKCGMREQRKLDPYKSVDEYWEEFWKGEADNEKGDAG